MKQPHSHVRVFARCLEAVQRPCESLIRPHLNFQGWSLKRIESRLKERAWDDNDSKRRSVPDESEARVIRQSKGDVFSLITRLKLVLVGTK